MQCAGLRREVEAPYLLVVAAPIGPGNCCCSPGSFRSSPAANIPKTATPSTYVTACCTAALVPCNTLFATAQLESHVLWCNIQRSPAVLDTPCMDWCRRLLADHSKSQLIAFIALHWTLRSNPIDCNLAAPAGNTTLMQGSKSWDAQ